MTPSLTTSGMPPIRDATTGTPARNASWMTSGLFSGQIDGTTSTSIDASAAGTRSWAIAPCTRTPALASRGASCPRYVSSPW